MADLARRGLEEARVKLLEAAAQPDRIKLVYDRLRAGEGQEPLLGDPLLAGRWIGGTVTR